MLAAFKRHVTTDARLYDRAVLKPVVIILAAGLVLAGCSDDAADQGGLLDALGRVRSTAETRKAVEYGSPAAVRALMDRDEARYQQLRGYGYSSVAMYGVHIEDALALDLDGFDGAVMAAESPEQATVLWGSYDVAAVDGKLRDLDIDSEAEFGGTNWRLADDYEIDFQNGPITDVTGTPQFNNIRTADGSFAFAAAAENVTWVTAPGDRTLADDDVLAPLASCLGDVVAAQLRATGEAVGVRADATEVICLLRDQAAVTEALKGDMPSTGEPWDRALPGAEVGKDGSLTRITVPARDDEPVGRVLRLMMTRDLDALR